MTSSPSLTTAPLPLSGQSGIGWSIRRPSPGRPGDGRHDQLGNFQTALLGRITPASTGDVLRSNETMQAFARKAGFTMTGVPADARLIRVVKDLATSSAASPCKPA